MRYAGVSGLPEDRIPRDVTSNGETEVSGTKRFVRHPPDTFHATV